MFQRTEISVRQFLSCVLPISGDEFTMVSHPRALLISLWRWYSGSLWRKWYSIPLTYPKAVNLHEQILVLPLDILLLLGFFKYIKYLSFLAHFAHFWTLPLGIPESSSVDSHPPCYRFAGLHSARSRELLQVEKSTEYGHKRRLKSTVAGRSPRKV